MIRNDMHVHSIQSLCGIHTVLEIVEIAAGKEMCMVNICDHGEAVGKPMNFGVITNKKRFPLEIRSSQGKIVKVLAGIEVNILDIEGNSDFPPAYDRKFDLVSAGFHVSIGKTPEDNTRALECYLKRYPLDILTHPCIRTYPLILDRVVKLSLEYGFALEINNTNLRVGKTDVNQLSRMIHLAVEKGANLMANSDGHTYFEIGEDDQIEEFFDQMQINGSEYFINYDDGKLDRFIKIRKRLRI
jgi:putative hydrolase